MIELNETQRRVLACVRRLTTMVEEQEVDPTGNLMKFYHRSEHYSSSIPVVVPPPIMKSSFFRGAVTALWVDAFLGLGEAISEEVLKSLVSARCLSFYIVGSETYYFITHAGKDYLAGHPVEGEADENGIIRQTVVSPALQRLVLISLALVVGALFYWLVIA